MKLFVKIFLWFLAAIALMVGMVVLLNWTVQTEPTVSRWKISVRNQTNIFAFSAAEAFQFRGEAGIPPFLERLRGFDSISEVDLIGDDSKMWLDKGINPENYSGLINAARNSEAVEIDTQGESAVTGRQVTFANGARYVMIVRWERPRVTPFFGESPFRYFRYGFLLLTGLLLCWALARYLSSPIGKIREATQELADGNLQTRVADSVGRRRDELADLARDFDDMAERIESLVTSQQRLTRDVSHELRSPLARMNVALELAKQRSGPDTAPLLDRIEKESERLNEMISRILILSKLESGHDDLEPEMIDLPELVEDVVADAEFEAQAKGKSVVITHTDACKVLGSDNLLRSAIENVLRNAVRYTADGTSVNVALRSQGHVATVRVSDHGGGVPEAELVNLFRPFYRVGEARERKTGGIGLGLAIAERAVHANKGSITAQNQNGGLLIEITLNRADAIP